MSPAHTDPPTIKGEGMAQPARMRQPDPKYTTCRGLTHFWSGSDAVEYAGGVITVELICRTCSTRRRLSISARSGETVTNKYAYPDGYVTKGRIPKQRYRRDFIQGVAAENTGRGTRRKKLRAIKGGKA